MVKNPTTNAGDQGEASSMSGLGRSCRVGPCRVVFYSRNSLLE